MPHLKGPVPQAQAKEGPMPQLVKKRRSGWAVLAAGALIASLLAVGPGSAAAIEIDDSNVPKQSRSETFSACVGDAAADRGFIDVSEDSVHAGAINCIAYYEITIGKTADTYAPGADVTRSQMVLFMERAADLTGADADDVLGDFAENGSNPVTRADMAVLLVKLLASAASTVVQIDADEDNRVTYGLNGEFSLTPDPRRGNLDYFRDARDETPRHVDNLISAAYELGISNGVGGGTSFDPFGAVTRAQMASFISRTLAHTTVRPAGLSAQSVSSHVQISLRDSNFIPIDNELIDVFFVKPGRVDDAFRVSGSCSRLPDTVPAGASRCKIDRGDNLTEADGNVEFDLNALRFVGDTRVVWAWTGDLGDTFDEEETVYVEIEVVQGPLQPTRALVTSSLRPGARMARYGADITFTVQLQHYDSVRGIVLDAVPNGRDFEYRLTNEIWTVGTLIVDDDGVPVLDDQNALTYTLPRLTGKSTDIVQFGPDGYGEFVLTLEDPRPHRDDHDDPLDIRWTLVAVDVAGTPYVVDVGQGGASPGDATGSPPGHRNDFTTVPGDHDDDAETPPVGMTYGWLRFDDNRGNLMTVVLIEGAGPQGPFYEYQDSGGETTYVTVAALNDYGELVPGVDVKVTATTLVDGTDGTACVVSLDPDPAVNDDGDPDTDVPVAREYQTGRFGTARVAHTGPKGNTANSQRLVAVFPGDDPATYEYGCEPSPTGRTADTGELVTPDALRPTIHWIGPDSSAGRKSVTAQPINVADTGGDVIVVGTGGSLVALLYDSTDEFKAPGADGGIESVSMDDFEAALDDALANAGENRVTAIQLTWDGYNYRDPDDITEFTLSFVDDRMGQPIG
jgi:hypothetical protein